MAQRAPDGKNQLVIFPELLQEKVSGGPHAARFFLYLAETLKLKLYARSTQGAPPFARPTLIAVLLYAMHHGKFSAPGIRKWAEDSIGVHWLLDGMNLPGYKTIERLMHGLLAEVDTLFVQILLICEQLSLIGKERGYIDGTKIKANASKHKAMSYKYLTERLERRQQECEALFESLRGPMEALASMSDDEMKQRIAEEASKVHRLLQRHHQQALKNREQQIFNPDAAQTGEAAPVDREVLNVQSALLKRAAPEQYETTLETLNNIAFAKQRIEKMTEAKETLETKWRESEGNKAIPDDKQINFTDADSSIMVTKHQGVQQCYNHFALVDAKAHIILGTHTSNHASDQLSLTPTIDQAEAMYGSLKGLQLGADAGFFSANNIRYAEGRKIDLYVSYPEAKHPYAKDKFAYDAVADAYTCPAGATLPQQQVKRNGQIGDYYNPDACAACRRSGQCTKAKDGVRKIERDLEADAIREAAKEKANSEQGRDILRQRKSVPEPVWGNMKTVDGLTQIQLRGLPNATLEFRLHAVMHNIRKIMKVYWNSASYQETVHGTQIQRYTNTA